MPSKLSQLRNLLIYDPVVGTLNWSPGCRRPGDPLSPCKRTTKGYVLLRVLGREFTASRVAFFLFTGRELSDSEKLRFKDGNPSNLCWSNLQLLKDGKLAATDGTELARPAVLRFGSEREYSRHKDTERLEALERRWQELETWCNAQFSAVAAVRAEQLALRAEVDRIKKANPQYALSPGTRLIAQQQNKPLVGPPTRRSPRLPRLTK